MALHRLFVDFKGANSLVERKVMYNILMSLVTQEAGIICLNESYSKSHTGKCLIHLSFRMVWKML